jgi:hypothetical protein
MTPSDLEQFLENVLSSLSELLRVRCAFLVTPGEESFQIEAQCGRDRVTHAFLQEHDLSPVLQEALQDPGDPRFSSVDGFMLRPLCTKSRDAVLGLLVIERWPMAPDIEDRLQKAVTELIEQAEVALEDRHLQQGIFVALQQIMPDIERIQKRRQLMRYVTSLPVSAKDGPSSQPDFGRWVKDALSHYWGGPKLAHSPLLELNVVAAARERFDGDAVRALRTVLQQAIEALRPQGEQSMLSPEWTLYNILDLKFRQGCRMNEIAYRLAISESDLYRKQRAAIAEVARMLANMEQRGASA